MKIRLTGTLLIAGLVWIATGVAVSGPKPKPTPTPTPFAAGTAPLHDPSPSPSPSPEPFWKTKKDLYKKMNEDRYIVVSAHVEDGGKGKILTIVTAGIIHAPVASVHKTLMNFKEYSSFVPYIEETSYDTVTHNLFVHGALLGYHVRMTLHIDEHGNDKGRQIHWRSISGAFVGMEGTINEEEKDLDHTETSMEARYEGATIPIPSFIIKWGLEFAGQRATAAMRSRIESDWSGSKKH